VDKSIFKSAREHNLKNIDGEIPRDWLGMQHPPSVALFDANSG
jgi:excinuclease UvrABC ATPase subunit